MYSMLKKCVAKEVPRDHHLLFTVLRNYMGKRVSSNLSTDQQQGLREIRSLSLSGAIKIGISDKGGEFAVLSQEHDRAITRLHLQDASVYSRSSPEEFRRQYRRLNRKWVEVSRSANLPKGMITRLRCDHHRMSSALYANKDAQAPPDRVTAGDPSVFKVRPIISNVGGPTDPIAWFLNLVLVQLFQFIPAHLPNTSNFLQKLREARLQKECVMESFDVTSLYTNVSNKCA
ncbi:unnamed protein product [Heligmosomoides polygyrus]|uniref:Reverse transcriptase domain-containing protein n=1 Tax=Heligmosomoides polygyrus TaxID=6339 RepID=A0A183FTD1_HELPZ|nr:unnamed protein product [Heligmosomoides polygyrus]